MPKTYLATQTEVAAVEQKADEANTAINATDTGLGALNTAVETIQSTQQTDDTRINDLETAIGDENSGLTKSIVDLDAQINEAGTGLEGRVVDLEQGGTTTTKFRTHSPTGAYEDGEIIQRNGLIYKSNAVIDGSTTPVPFVEGTAGQTWALLGYPKDELDSKAVQGFSNIPTVRPMAALVDTDGSINYATGVTITHLGRLIGLTGPIQDQLDIKATIGVTEPPTQPKVALMGSNGTIGYEADVSTTELGYLSGVTSAIQTQLDSRPEKGFTSNPEELRVAYVNESGEIVYSGSINATELMYLNGSTSNLQEQLDARPDAPSHFSITQYSTNNGVTLGTTENNIVFYSNSGERAYISAGGSFRALDSDSSLGSSGERWSRLYAANTTNVSSDARLKTEPKDIPEALLNVWFQYVKPVSYEMLAEVGTTDTNKYKVGFIAQDVIAAFDAAGLDWHEWDVVCQGSDFVEKEGDTHLGAEGEDYYSLNYDACKLIESMAIRRKLGIEG